jgi:tRNA-specific adenosine deaminase 2
MCAAALRDIGLIHVVYAARNDRFGGCGSVLSVHDAPMDGWPSLVLRPSVDEYRVRAIILLRQFYLMENTSGLSLSVSFDLILAPKPRTKARRTLNLTVD